MAWSRRNEDLPSTDDETDSTTDADIDSLFDSSEDDETDITSGADTDSPSEIDDDTDDDASLFDGETIAAMNCSATPSAQADSTYAKPSPTPFSIPTNSFGFTGM